MPFTAGYLKTAMEDLLKGGFIGLAKQDGSELSGNNYSRSKLQATDNIGGVVDSTWRFVVSETSDGAVKVTNEGEVHFNDATGNWPTATKILLFDSSGTIVYDADLSEPISIEADQFPVIPSGSFDLTITLTEESSGGA